MIRRTTSMLARSGRQRTVLVFRAGPMARLPARAARGEVIEATARNFDRLGELDTEVEALARQRLGWRDRACDHCFLLRWQGRARACGWVREAGEIGIDEAGISLGLGPSEVCLFDFFVAPAARGRGLYTDFLAQLRARYAANATLIYCEAENTPSLRGIVRAGFAQVVEIGAAHFAGLVLPTSLRVDAVPGFGGCAAANGMHAATTGSK